MLRIDPLRRVISSRRKPMPRQARSRARAKRSVAAGTTGRALGSAARASAANTPANTQDPMTGRRIDRKKNRVKEHRREKNK